MRISRPFRNDLCAKAAKKRHPTDAAAAKKEVDAWRASHQRPKATIADVADAIDHVRKVAGVDHVGIGSDFDGITENVVGLEDVSTYPSIFAELAKRGWSDAEATGQGADAVARLRPGAIGHLSHRRPVA